MTWAFVKNAILVAVGLILINRADGGVRVYERSAIRPPLSVDFEASGQWHGHQRAKRAVAGDRLVGDGDIADLVDAYRQFVANASRLDDHRLADAERVGDAEQRLEGVALRAARRATERALPRLGP